MAAHSSILAWRIPWIEKPGRVHSMGSQRAGHDWATNTYAYVTHVQSCLTLCDPMDYSSPGSSVHRISQARILEQVAISFSRGSCRLEIEPMSHVSCIGLWIFTTAPPGKFIYVLLNYFAVPLKQAQHSKSVICQLKVKNKPQIVNNLG